MRFDLTDLQLFVHVAEAGSLTAGAARSHLTLASASQRVRGMEDVLGVPLLVRGARGVQPTEAGRTLLRQAHRVLQQMEQLRGELAAYGCGLQGQVRLLCNTSALAEHLPRPLARFLADHPRLSVDLEERPSDEIADALRAGRADVGIVSDAAHTDGLHYLPFRPDPLVLAVPRGHTLAGRRSATLADAAAFDLVGLAAGSPLQALVVRQARRLGRPLRWRVRVGSADAVCRMVAEGIGVGIVPAATARRLGRSVAIARVPLDEPWARRHLLLCTGPDPAALSPHAVRLVEALQAPG